MKTEQHGLTLIELVVAMAVLAIAVTMVIPAMGEFVSRNRMAAQANELVAATQLARSEAIKRGTAVNLCARSAVQAVCTDAAAGAGNCVCSETANWENGWFIYVATNNDAAAILNAGDQLIAVREALGGNSTLRSGTTTPLSFNAEGLARPTNDTFLLCPRDNAGGDDDENVIAMGRQIVVNPAGRVDVRTLPEGGEAPATCGTGGA